MPVCAIFMRGYLVLLGMTSLRFKITYAFNSPLDPAKSLLLQILYPMLYCRVWLKANFTFPWEKVRNTPLHIDSGSGITTALPLTTCLPKEKRDRNTHVSGGSRRWGCREFHPLLSPADRSSEMARSPEPPSSSTSCLYEHVMQKKRRKKIPLRLAIKGY